MRIVRDSNKTHWAIGKHAECPRCETVVELETLDDFRTIKYNNDKVIYDCPRCKQQQDFHRPMKPKLSVQPFTKITWHEAGPPDKVLFPENVRRYNVNAFAVPANDIDMSI